MFYLKSYFRKLKVILIRIINPRENISDRLISGGAWNFGFKVIEFILSFITLSFAGKLLSPFEFGLIGIAYLTLNTISVFTEIGLHKALIQKKEIIDSYLNTAWTLSILRSSILFLILWASAPIFSYITNESEAAIIIQILSISIILESFINIHTIYFVKKLQFRKQFLFLLSGLLVGFITTIVGLIIFNNLWGLVIGKLLGSSAKVIASYLMNIKHTPKFSLKWDKAKELFNFSKWLLGSSILIFFITQGDDIFVAIFLGTLSLGYYQMAYRFSNLAATQITHTITSVTFPIYSKLQDMPLKMRDCYFSILQITLYFSFPIAGFLIIVSPEFIYLFLGENWLPMIPLMQVLCLFGLTRSINATFGPIFEAVGKPEILTRLGLIQLISIIAMIFPLSIIFNLMGVALTVTISNFIILYFALHKVSQIINVKKKDIYLIILQFTLSLLGSLFVISIFKMFFLNQLDIVFIFLGSIMIGIITYLIFLKIFRFSILKHLYLILVEKSFD